MTLIAFLFGCWQFRRSVTSSFRNPYAATAFEHGREFAHRLTLRTFEE